MHKKKRSYDKNRNSLKNGGMDGTRTRDPWRDRPVQPTYPHLPKELLSSYINILFAT